LKPLEALPSIPRSGDEPVFREPWEAKAFALAVALHEAGLFTWAVPRHEAIDEIAAAGAGDDGSRYYEHWLAALEKMVAAKTEGGLQGG